MGFVVNKPSYKLASFEAHLWAFAWTAVNPAPPLLIEFDRNKAGTISESNPGAIAVLEQGAMEKSPSTCMDMLVCNLPNVERVDPCASAKIQRSARKEK
jgi:hypothetical protein